MIFTVLLLILYNIAYIIYKLYNYIFYIRNHKIIYQIYMQYATIQKFGVCKFFIFVFFKKFIFLFSNDALN